MNEIISALERAKEKAYLDLLGIRPEPISSDAIDFRAVYEMAYNHLRDTIHLFRHARKLRQELIKQRTSQKGDSNAPD